VRSLRPAPAPPSGAPSLRPCALVVDDSAAMRREVVTALEAMGVCAFQAEDGAVAWRRLQARPVDLIVTDVNMPVLDGLKLIRLVRSAGQHRQTPIVVVTTLSAEPDRRRALDLGASGYLVKPVVAQMLQDLARRLLGAV